MWRTRGERVLVLDPHRFKRSRLSVRLQLQGYKVVSCNSVGETRQALLANTFRFFFAERDTPCEGGSIAGLLAGVNPRPLLILVTNDPSFDLDQARTRGADAVILRPITLSKLNDVMHFLDGLFSA